MKHPHTPYLLLLAAALLCAACQDDLGVSVPTSQAGAYFVIDGSSINDTRAVYMPGDIDHTDFALGDEVGIFALDANGDAVTDEPQNARYIVSRTPQSITNPDGTTSELCLLPATAADDLRTGHHSYAFYFPYDPDVHSLDDIRAYSHAILPDQATDSVEREHSVASKFQQSDLLWDVASPEDNMVKVNMDHAMAHIIVFMDDVHYDTIPGAQLLDQPLLSTGVDLTAASLSDQTYTVPNSGTDADPAALHDIEMWRFDYDDKGAVEYRVAVPACRTIRRGVDFIRLVLRRKRDEYGRYNTQDESTIERSRVFRLTEDLDLLPGHDYYFHLNRSASPLPEVTDDDSWVLDVLDPVTGQPVGLLCREYIRYQPAHTADPTSDDNFYLEDQVTNPWEGQTISYPRDPDYKAHPTILNGISVSSQVWVFYNMLDTDPTTPDLSHGTAMRFIFDFRAVNSGKYDNGNTFAMAQAAGARPYPHYDPTHAGSHIGIGSGASQGIYTPLHGHDWINDNTSNNDVHHPTGRSTRAGEVQPDNTRGSDYYYEFYQVQDDGMPGCMHGGTIYWDGSKNRISHYEMPAQRVSNEIARDQGHISIPLDGSAPFVSYKPVNGYTDAERSIVNGQPTPNRAGIIRPHWIVDRREENGRMVTTRYPIVKIGFNQFWMSKSLRATTLTDGTPLTNYIQLDADGHQVFGGLGYDPWLDTDAGWIGPGYFYPEGTSGTEHFLPYNRYGTRGCRDLGISLLYNYSAIRKRSIVPNHYETNFLNQTPHIRDFQKLANYLGWCYIPKLMSNGVRELNDDPLIPLDSALIQGRYLSFGSYTANVSGFNLRADGSITGTAIADIGTRASLLLLPDDDSTEGIPVVSFNQYDCWKASRDLTKVFFSDAWVLTKALATDNGATNVEARRSKVFAPIRCFATYLYQNEDDSWTPAAAIRARLAKQRAKTRTIYVGIEEVK